MKAHMKKMKKISIRTTLECILVLFAFPLGTGTGAIIIDRALD